MKHVLALTALLLASLAALQAADRPTTDVQLAAGQAHGFFNKDPWQTVTLIAADRFLVQQGLLTGSPTLAPPDTGEKLVPDPGTTAGKTN